MSTEITFQSHLLAMALTLTCQDDQAYSIVSIMINGQNTPKSPNRSPELYKGPCTIEHHEEYNSLQNMIYEILDFSKAMSEQIQQ